MNELKAAAGMVEGFLEDARLFLDLLKAEGYFTESMELTDKGKEVLRKYYEKHLT